MEEGRPITRSASLLRAQAALRNLDQMKEHERHEPDLVRTPVPKSFRRTLSTNDSMRAGVTRVASMSPNRTVDIGVQSPSPLRGQNSPVAAQPPQLPSATAAPAAAADARKYNQQELRPSPSDSGGDLPPPVKQNTAAFESRAAEAAQSFLSHASRQGSEVRNPAKEERGQTATFNATQAGGGLSPHAYPVEVDPRGGVTEQGSFSDRTRRHSDPAGPVASGRKANSVPSPRQVPPRPAPQQQQRGERRPGKGKGDDREDVDGGPKSSAPQSSGMLSQMMSEIARLRSQQSMTMAQVANLAARSDAEHDLMMMPTVVPQPSPRPALRSGSAHRTPQQTRRYVPARGTPRQTINTELSFASNASTTGYTPRVNQPASQPPQDGYASKMALHRSASGKGVTPPSVAVGRRNVEKQGGWSPGKWRQPSASPTRDGSPRGYDHHHNAREEPESTVSDSELLGKAVAAAERRARAHPVPSSRPTRTSADARRLKDQRSQSSGRPFQPQPGAGAQRTSSTASTAVTEFDYSRNKLKEFEKRKREYLEARRSTSRPEATAAKNGTATPRSSTSQASRVRPNSRSGSTQRYQPGAVEWEPLPNRHAAGGSRPNSRSGTAQSTTAPVTPAQQVKRRHPSQAADRLNSPQAAAIASPLGLADGVSPLSEEEASPRGRSTSTSISHLQRPPFHGLPILQYLVHMRGRDTAQVGRELEHIATIGNDHTHPEAARSWLALSQLANHPSVVAHVFAPLLIAELQFMDASEDCSPGSRNAQLLCAVAGLGPLAARALDLLLALLQGQVADQKLVALAIRAVGGNDAIRELSNLAATATTPAVAASAMYALSIMPTAVVGRTTICCVGCHRMQNQLSFYQPPNEDGGAPAPPPVTSAQGAVVQHQPDYRVTHVFFDAATVCRRITTFIASPQYRPAAPYATSGIVLVDFIRWIPAVCKELGLAPHIATDVAQMGAELFANVAPPDVHQHRMHGSYEAELYDEATTGKAIVALFQRLRDVSGTTDPSLKDQALLTFSALPVFIAGRALPALLEYITTTATGQDHQNPVEFLSLGCLTLGRLAAKNDVETEAVFDTVQYLCTNLENDAPKLRQSACIALGTIGEPAADVATQILHATLMKGQLKLQTGCWAICQMGHRGVAVLADLLGQPTTPHEYIEAAATALGKSAEVSKDMRTLDTVCTRLVHVGVSLSASAPPVAEACVHALAGIGASLLEDSLREQKWRSDEAAMYYREERPNPLVKMLQGVLAAESAAGSVLIAAAEHLAALGGAHGEVYLTQILLEGTSSKSRLAAASGLAKLGPKVIRCLALALNDSDQATRNCVVSSIKSFGVDRVVEFLGKYRPADQRTQVRQCCEDFLRFHSEVPVIQSLCDALASQEAVPPAP